MSSPELTFADSITAYTAGPIVGYLVYPITLYVVGPTPTVLKTLHRRPDCPA